MQVKSLGITLAITAVAALAPAGAAQAGVLSKAKATGATFTGERLAPPSASASAVDIGNGLVKVSSAQSSSESSSWSAASVGGTSLYGKETTANGDQEHTGVLADLGPVLDEINTGGNECQDAGGVQACAAILAAETDNHNDGPWYSFGHAHGVIAAGQVTTADGQQVTVLLLPAGAHHGPYCAAAGAAVATVIVEDGDDQQVETLDGSSAAAGCAP